MRRIFSPLLGLALLAWGLLLCGCAPNAQDLWRRVVAKSGPQGYVPVDLPAPPFHLAGLLKSQRPGEPLVVYLEGDGRAIVGGRPSSDPTPRAPQSLDLALQDPAPNVLYLARVGQYSPAYATSQYRAFWSDRRLAPEVVEAASHAIDKAKELVGTVGPIHLLGYSGGGGLAALLAEKRDDVRTLVTVAGLLDTDWWVSTRGYRPLAGSLNPAAESFKIKGLPQIHFYGAKDRIIPPEMSAVYAAKTAFASLTRVEVDSDHYQAWTGRWKDLLRRYVLPLRDRAGGAGADGPL
ncbi:MAG: alpha/beta hydrolase [Deltaproteobacteria bacterium]|jgi:dienelactone hydrolase|nr:alpha/beta hydrolase [Deltaproteobacteria bacterium]